MDFNVVLASEPVELSLSIDQSERLLVTQKGVPLDVIESALPRLVGSFSGKLVIGSVMLFPDEQFFVSDVIAKRWHLSFQPASYKDEEREFLHANNYH